MDFDELSDTAEYALPPPGAATQTRVLPRRSRSISRANPIKARVRPNNEDHFLIVRFGRSLQTLSTNLPDGMLRPTTTETGYGLIVADGMGGKAAGEVASRAAIARLIELTLETPDWILTPDDALMEEVITVGRRFRDVNEAVVEQARHDPRLCAWARR